MQQVGDGVVGAVVQGQPVLKYGQVIGQATASLQPGDHVHVHNLQMSNAGAAHSLASVYQPTVYLEDTARFAAMLVAAVSGDAKTRTLLLHGDLGSGKTTLTRFMVLSLPGGSEAEVASPSFTLCNHYATVPPVLHCDLYRCAGSLPEELFDALECARIEALGAIAYPGIAHNIGVARDIAAQDSGLHRCTRTNQMPTAQACFGRR